MCGGGVCLSGFGGAEVGGEQRSIAARGSKGVGDREGGQLRGNHPSQKNAPPCWEEHYILTKTLDDV